MHFIIFYYSFTPEFKQYYVMEMQVLKDDVGFWRVRPDRYGKLVADRLTENVPQPRIELGCDVDLTKDATPATPQEWHKAIKKFTNLISHV